MDLTVATVVFPIFAVAANVVSLGVLFFPFRLFSSLRQPLFLAGAVAGFSAAGSLFLSEVAGFVPCGLCWFQRVFMYSLAVVLLVAFLRRDYAVWVYAVVLSGLGLAVSLWHYVVERVPGLSGVSGCDLQASCAVRWVDAFGFVTIPYMAASGFVLVLCCAWAARRLKIEGFPARFDRQDDG